MALEPTAWNADPLTRMLAGVSLGGRTGRLKTAILRCRGEGWNLRCLAADAAVAPPPPADVAGLSQAVVEALVALADQSEIPLASLDVVGLARFREPIGESLASRIAEALGITVVGGFSLRDEAAGGAGRPLTPIPDWFLFRSGRQTRLLIHLGANLRVTWLSAGAPPTAAVCFDAGPCCDFLDGLAMDLSQGKMPYDPSGRFAVQGRCEEALVQEWLSHPFLLAAPPRFLTGEEFGTAFRQSSLAAARDRRISGRDLLCSANHFAIRALEEALRRFAPLGRAVDEVFVTGGGSWNGLLWKRLRETLDPVPVERSDRAGIPSEVRAAVHAALLAYCAMENLPANIPSLTGARRPVVLGQLTPGSAENWDRFICNIYDRFDEDEASQAA